MQEIHRKSIEATSNKADRIGTNIEYLVFDDIFVIKDYFEILFDDKLTIDVAIKFLGNIE